MDQFVVSSDSVLETLLKTNRPLTGEEAVIIQESIASTNAKFKTVESQISDTTANIQALKSQVQQAETKLQRLREEEAAILETLADHRRVLSPFRNLPEDVLREICIACVQVDMPTLSYRTTPTMPYSLAQISSGMRRIALTTPSIWTSMDVRIRKSYDADLDKRDCAILANRVTEWFERAGGLALTIFINLDPPHGYGYSSLEDIEYDPSNIFFDALLRYAPRWSELHCDSSQIAIRIAALTAADVPLLHSVSLRIKYDSAMFRYTTLLTIPTLRQLTLEVHSGEDVPELTVNWAILTTLTLVYRDCSSSGQIGRILQQTKCLVVCDISVGPGVELYPSEISLPFLEVLSTNESIFGTASTSSILDILTAPILKIFHIRGSFLELSLSNFVKRSPNIRELSLPFENNEEYMTELLHCCPSLSILSLLDAVSRPKRKPFDANRFLRAFVVEETDVGVICPRLQNFVFSANIKFSPQTLRTFIEAKQRGISTTPSPWKRVVVDFRWIDNPEIYQEMLHLLSQKQDEGLEVSALVNKWDDHRRNYVA